METMGLLCAGAFLFLYLAGMLRVVSVRWDDSWSWRLAAIVAGLLWPVLYVVMFAILGVACFVGLFVGYVRTANLGESVAACFLLPLAVLMFGWGPGII